MNYNEFFCSPYFNLLSSRIFNPNHVQILQTLLTGSDGRFVKKIDQLNQSFFDCRRNERHGVRGICFF